MLATDFRRHGGGENHTGKPHHSLSFVTNQALLNFYDGATERSVAGDGHQPNTP